MAPLPTGSGRNPIKKYLAVEFRRRKKAKWESVGVAAGGAGSADAAAADPDGGSDDKEVSSRRDARSVYRYWKTLLVSSSESARALARLALRHWMRPLSSASCERVFSYLTKMDTADRRSTGSSTLRNIISHEYHIMSHSHAAGELASRTPNARGAGCRESAPRSRAL